MSGDNSSWTPEELDKYNGEMAEALIVEIGETLRMLGCAHGHGEKRMTPPMLYPEMIKCVVRHHLDEMEAHYEARLSKQADEIGRYVRLFAAERERCAKIAEYYEALDHGGSQCCGSEGLIAAKIRSGE